MINARVISVQHPKNVGVVVQTIERWLNPLEEVGKMA
jgi:hypothetical protein